MWCLAGMDIDSESEVLLLQELLRSGKERVYDGRDVVFMYIGRDQSIIGRYVRSKLPSSQHFSSYTLSTCVASASEVSGRTCLFDDGRIVLTARVMVLR